MYRLGNTAEISLFKYGRNTMTKSLHYLWNSHEQLPSSKIFLVDIYIELPFSFEKTRVAKDAIKGLHLLTIHLSNDDILDRGN